MSKFDSKDKLDALIYKTYNVLSDIIFGFNFQSKSLVRRNAAYKDIHSGQRCFILGTGPSLACLGEDQIERLSTEIVFGVNSLYKSTLANKITPKYYTLIDNLYWEDARLYSTSLSPTFGEIANKYLHNPPVFITDPRAKYVVEDIASENNPIYIYSKKYPTEEMSADITGNVYAAMNCVTYSVLAAIFMGFKEVYILGCDYNAFCNFGSGHCYDDKDELKNNKYNLGFYLKFYAITTEFHYLTAKLAKNAGIKVINLTPGSLLDAYPRESLEGVLGQC
ncbi:DUF115 domain-containing protein [Halopseudomonas laoshanensis]|uniref:DUF115 domain-containing protein n=1 Tax=Halopseudomonas laoshanensis TaxID=2268758 RepID=A0A7V7KUR8_9GAMM|nr:6-hydroxymethylpterin diphosphokinase MptE-like protein [Halopseudomonas laoshanensis]KAA0690840.1 DUF115 domain-containing protein [Halopseudomonas laoshanensis]